MHHGPSDSPGPQLYDTRGRCAKKHVGLPAHATAPLQNAARCVAATGPVHRERVQLRVLKYDDQGPGACLIAAAVRRRVQYAASRCSYRRSRGTGVSNAVVFVSPSLQVRILYFISLTPLSSLLACRDFETCQLFFHRLVVTPAASKFTLARQIPHPHTIPSSSTPLRQAHPPLACILEVVLWLMAIHVSFPTPLLCLARKAVSELQPRPESYGIYPGGPSGGDAILRRLGKILRRVCDKDKPCLVMDVGVKGARRNEQGQEAQGSEKGSHLISPTVGRTILPP